MPSFSRIHSLLIPVAVSVVLLGIHVLAPSSLDDKDQPKVAFYTQDIVDHGKWVLQYSDGVDIATKPPLYPWATASLSILIGKTTSAALLLPSFLCFLGVLLIVWDWGCAFGTRWAMEQEGLASGNDRGGVPNTAGYWIAALSALVWTTSYHVQRLQWTARSDMMVCLLGLGGIWAAWRLQSAPTAGKRTLWRWVFWGGMSLGALAKGPVALGVAFAALGVQALLQRSWKPILSLWPWFGLPVVLGFFALWFNAAYLEGGEMFWNTLVGNEFIERITGTGGRAHNARPIWYFVPVFMGRFLPWSVLLVCAIPRWWHDRLLRRDHPLLLPAAWLIGIFLVFSLSRGKRPDYILPAYAPSAVLVAVIFFDFIREGWTAWGWRASERHGIARSTKKTAISSDSRWRRWMATPQQRTWIAVALIGIACVSNASYFFLESEAARGRRSDRTQEFGTEAYRVIQKNPGPIVFCESRNSLVQFYLHTNQRNYTVEETVQRIREWEDAPSTPAVPLYVVTRTLRLERLEQGLREAFGSDELGSQPLDILVMGDAPAGKESSLVLLRWSFRRMSSQPGQ